MSRVRCGRHRDRASLRTLSNVPDDVDAALERLYGVPLEEFVSERKSIAAELRASGRREAAALVARAAKPTVSAWAVNQLTRRNRPAVDELLAAGERLVREQAEALRGGGEAFEQVQRDERASVRRLVDAAAKILDIAGRPPGSATRERIAATLRAAAVDEEGRELLAKGRLTRDLEPAGFDPIAAMAAMASRSGGATRARPRQARRGAAAPRPTDGREQLAHAREVMTAARERARERERASREAERDARAAEKAARVAEEEAESARRAASQARQRADAAGAAAAEARDDVARANAAVAAAKR